MQEYFLRLEPAAQARPLTASGIEKELSAQGLVPRRAWRIGQEWYVRVAAAAPEQLDVLRWPEGWRLAQKTSVADEVMWENADQVRFTGDVFTFALLLWPAVVALFELGDEGWQFTLKIVLTVWLGLMHLVAYRGGRGPLFGNSMLMLSGSVAAFWWTHPGPWMYAWLAIILIGLYAVIRGLLRGDGAAHGKAVESMQPLGERG